MFFTRSQEKFKEREFREQSERELRIKEQQLSEVTKRQGDLEMKLLRLNFNESETKNENERLQKVSRHWTAVLVLYSRAFVGEKTTGRAIARHLTKSRRIEELHLSIAESDEERKTRSSQVTCANLREFV